MYLLYLYVGISALLLLFFFVKELVFYLNSDLGSGEVIYSSISTYHHDTGDLHDYNSSTSSEIHAKIAFHNSLGDEIIANTNFYGKKELKMGAQVKIRYLKRDPSKIKLSSTSQLFHWSIFWAISTVLAIITFYYLPYASSQ